MGGSEGEAELGENEGEGIKHTCSCTHTECSTPEVNSWRGTVTDWGSRMGTYQHRAHAAQSQVSTD